MQHDPLIRDRLLSFARSTNDATIDASLSARGISPLL
jgi:hypothetical protein